MIEDLAGSLLLIVVMCTSGYPLLFVNKRDGFLDHYYIRG
jgi:hypothetical protein